MAGYDGFPCLIKVVSQDVHSASTGAFAEGSPEGYRSAIRAIFAGIEAVIWYSKSLAAGAIEAGPMDYTQFEISALKDKTYTVQENGRIKERANFLPLGTSMRLVSRLLSRGQVSNGDLTLDDESMGKVTASLLVRHRLTHPKSADDLDVSRDDFVQAYMTWGIVLAFAMNTAIEADKRMGTGMFPLSSPPTAQHVHTK
jgi:hypothetical protein